MKPISFIINTGKDTLEYMKLLLTSLRMNLDYDGHEILIFVDSDNENSVEYFREQKSNFKDLRIITHSLPFPVGYQRNKTLLTEYARYDIVSYLQSDMVIGPHYDTNILKHVQSGRILSATRVEPPLHPPSTVTITENMGTTPSEFNMERWNKFSERVKENKEFDYFFAPITYYKEDWLKLGGYDTQFRRSREDSDLVQRCIHSGIELKQIWSANVYHFTCVSSRGKNWFDGADDDARIKTELQKEADYYELKKFVRKWGAVNHGETKLQKVDVDLVVSNYNLKDLIGLEPFFSRVWLKSETDRYSVIGELRKENELANKLLGASEIDWNFYSHLYGMPDFDGIFNVGRPVNYNVLVEIDFNKIIKQNNQFLSNLQNMYHIITQSDIGSYELDGVIIHIQTITHSSSNIFCDNPKFDYNLIKIE
jgi:hypothetical protein